MKEFLLPHFYKKIAVSTGVLGIILLAITSSNPDFINFQPLILAWIFKFIILLSFLIYVFTKEKIESEKIAQLRINNILVSLITGVIYLVLDTFIEILYADENFDILSGYSLMMLVLMVCSVRFYFKKNIQTVVSS